MEKIIGDATKPVGNGHKLIIHCCNDEGKWGAGFVLALNKKWPQVKRNYQEWYQGLSDYVSPNGVLVLSDSSNGADAFHLGAIQVVDVAEDISVVNMIGQRSCGRDEYGHPTIRYYAIDECLRKVVAVAYVRNSSIHMPYLMGCGLAGGDWDIMSMMINKRLGNLDVTAYEFIP